MSCLKVGICISYVGCPDNCQSCTSLGSKRVCDKRGCNSGYVTDSLTGECAGKINLK